MRPNVSNCGRGYKQPATAGFVAAAGAQALQAWIQAPATLWIRRRERQTEADAAVDAIRPVAEAEGYARLLRVENP